MVLERLRPWSPFITSSFVFNNHLQWKTFFQNSGQTATTFTLLIQGSFVQQNEQQRGKYGVSKRYRPLAWTSMSLMSLFPVYLANITSRLILYNCNQSSGIRDPNSPFTLIQGMKPLQKAWTPLTTRIYQILLISWQFIIMSRYPEQKFLSLEMDTQPTNQLTCLVCLPFMQRFI